MIDTALLVVSANATPSLVARAVARLAADLGVVLNRMAHAGDDRLANYYGMAAITTADTRSGPRWGAGCRSWAARNRHQVMYANSWRPIVLIVGESCLLTASVAASSYARLGPDAWSLFVQTDGIFKILVVVGVCQLCLYYSDLYELRGLTGFRDLLVRLLQAL